MVWNTSDRWHVSASSGVTGVSQSCSVINVSVVSSCRCFVIEVPRWTMKAKLSLLCVFAAAGTEGQPGADARCVTGCILRHTVLLKSRLFWEL